MPRPPRMQFPGASYHVVTRGDGRKKLFHDQGHYERFTRGLEEEVQRCGWIVLASKEELREWVFGSEDFLRRMVVLAEGRHPHRHQSTSRRLRTVRVQEILSATASKYGVASSDDAGFRSPDAGRDMAAWLCRRWTGATLAELGSAFGLAGTDSVSNLVRRAARRYQESATWQETATKIETALGLNTEHKA